MVPWLLFLNYVLPNTEEESDKSRQYTLLQEHQPDKASRQSQKNYILKVALRPPDTQGTDPRTAGEQTV